MHRGRSFVMNSSPVTARTRDRLTASIFASSVAIGLAKLYWISRVGFANPMMPVFVTLGLALFVISVPSIVAVFIDSDELHKGSRWWRSAPFLSIGCIVLTAIAGLIVYPSGVNLGVLIAALGTIAFLLVVFLWARRARLVSVALLLGLTACMTAWVGGIAWGTRYKTPLFWEQISDRGNVHHDPLYYVSMANSMRAYGVPSTGLDGVPYMPYHYGSAWLNSQWADLASVDVLSFYSLGPTVLMAPVFLFALLLLAAEARSAWRLARPETAIARPLEREPVAWLVLVGATIGFIPSSALDALGIWNRHVLISESYLTGLGVFLLCCGLSVDWWASRAKDGSRGDALFLLLVVPILLVCLGFLKVSLMLLALAALLWVVIRSGFFRRRVFLTASLLALFVSAITFKLVSVAAQNQGIVPLSFMRNNADPRWWPYFILGHLFWSWVYIALRIREENTPTLSDLFAAIKQGRLLDAEIVAVVALCGFFPGEIISIHGGSAVYFSDVQRWLAAPLTMAIVARAISSRANALSRKGFASIRLRTVIGFCIAIPVGLTIVFNVARAVRNAAGMNIALRNELTSYSGFTPASRFVRDPAVLAAGLHRAPDFAMISALRALDAEPRAIKRRTLLFVPQSDSAFWNIFVGEPDRCSFAPFVGPATSGLALLDGMPPASCDLTDQYGMTAYTRRTTPQTAADVAPAALCTKAKRKGFARVIVLQRALDGSYSTPAIEC
jgi:hypothetical protein